MGRLAVTPSMTALRGRLFELVSQLPHERTDVFHLQWSALKPTVRLVLALFWYEADSSDPIRKRFQNVMNILCRVSFTLLAYISMLDQSPFRPIHRLQWLLPAITEQKFFKLYDQSMSRSKRAAHLVYGMTSILKTRKTAQTTKHTFRWWES